MKTKRTRATQKLEIAPGYQRTIQLVTLNGVVGKPVWESRDARLIVADDGMSVTVRPKRGRKRVTITVVADVELE